MAVNFQLAQQQYFDDNGDPVAGALLEFFDPTTTTPRAVYSDAALSIALAQPVEADAAGVWPQIYLQNGTYKYRITDPSGNVPTLTVDQVDPGLSTAAGALPVANGGTGASTAAGARSNLGAASQAAHDALELRMDDVEADLAAPILAAANTLTFATSLTPIFTTFETRSVTLTDNFTLNAPTVTAGQKIRLILIQDATGSRTWAVNAAYKWPGGIVPALSVSANAIDVLGGYARTTGEIQVTSFKRQDILADIAIIEENQTSGAAGGTFTSGADRTRVLNTEVSDLGAMVTLASNQITITNAGTYEISWSAPAYTVNDHQSLLYNITSAAEVKRGSTERMSVDGVTRSTGRAIIVLTTAAVFEIRHRCETTKATDGLGVSGGFGTEVFTQVIVRKLK